MGAPPRPSQSRTFFCPLFDHQKHSDACTVLRAKRVCRVNCTQYFEFAKEKPDAIRDTLEKYRGSITASLKIRGDSELFSRVVPAGKHNCPHCGQPFKYEKGLEKHLRKKHARVMAKRRK